MADPFRDGEEVRVEMLTQEGAELEAELEEIRSRLPENNDAFLRRLEQQRDEARAELARVEGSTGGASPRVPSPRDGPLLDLSGRRVPSPIEPPSSGPLDRLEALEQTNARLRRDLDAARAAAGEDRAAYAAWLERDRDDALARHRALEVERAENRERIRHDWHQAQSAPDSGRQSAALVLIAAGLGAVGILAGLLLHACY
jgi:hypothetical protein